LWLRIWGTYAGQVLNFDAAQTAKLTGKHALYLVFVGDDVANVDSLQFAKTSANNPPPPPPPPGDAPPQFLSAKAVADAMTTGPNGESLISWGYPANRFGAVNSVGARLKHASNLANYCNISPYQHMLSTILIQWMTVGFMNRASVPAGHNIALEMIPMPTHGRIKPSYGGPTWVALNAPTGAVTSGLIGANGTTFGIAGDIKLRGRITRIPENAIVHPWAVVDAAGSIDAQIGQIVSSNPSDPQAESKLDDIASTWWVRLVPYDASRPIGDITSNPVLAVASADPYVSRPRLGLTDDAQCNASIAATTPTRLTTSWQQLSWHTSLDSADKHTDGEGSGISNAEFLRLPPPGYQ
jgi:hypothetical protein